MIKQEWKKLLTNPVLVLVLVVIMLIPSMYAGLFLSSMWDPYGDIDKLPVAVVNQDQPVSYNNKELNIGSDLVENLKESGALDFHFLDEKEAHDGLLNGTYYMVITIPSDFSYKASTASDYEPEQMQLLYDTNPATNYIATKLSQSAVSKIVTTLQQEVTETYVEALVDTINDIGGDLESAADGASQLLDGESALTEGMNTLGDGAGQLYNGAGALREGTAALSDGAVALANGATTLNQGAFRLYNSLQTYLDGTTQVNNGITSLYSQVPTLVTGTENIYNASQSIAAGNRQILGGFEGDNGLLSGAAALSQGAATLDGLVRNADKNPLVTLSSDEITYIQTTAGNTASEAINAQNQIVQLVAAGLQAQYGANGVALDTQTAIGMATGYVQQLAAGVASTTAISTANALVGNINNRLPSTLGIYTEQLSNGASALNSGIGQVYQGTASVQNYLDQLATGASALNSGAQSLQNGVNALYDGSTTLVSNNAALEEGTQAVANGTTELSTGADSLSQGAAQVNSGAASLESGAGELNDGVIRINEALPELSDGTEELYNGLSDGASQIEDASLSESNAEMMAAPVEAVENQVTTVADNGTAMAAYMMSVGLWVACLAFCLMYPLTQHGELKNGFSWWASKASVLFPVSVVQAIALILILKFALGFNPSDLGATIGIAVLSSVAFMSIMYFFNALIGKVGSFIMLVFMVFQLAGSAGTYPIELSGPLAAALHKYVPFTYTVNAFRSTIGGGASYRTSVIVLLAITLVFTLLTILLFVVRSGEEKRGHVNVHDRLAAKGLA